MAACTRASVSGFSRSGVFSARETVIRDTFASFATSFRDAIFSSAIAAEYRLYN